MTYTTSYQLFGHLAWSFVTGAVAVSTLTLTADRFGSKIAGVLGGFPSTVAASLIFVSMGRGELAASEAAQIIPLMMALYGILLTIFCFMVGRGVLLAILTSVAAWTALAALPLWYGPPSFYITLVIFLISLLACFYLLEVGLLTPSKPGVKNINLSVSQIIFRIVCGGTLVASSVYLGVVGSPLVGGMMAAFPAVTLATLIVSYQNGGAEFARAMGKSMMLSGMINVTVYATAVRFFYPSFGYIIGTGISFACVFLSGLVTFYLAEKKMR